MSDIRIPLKDETAELVNAGATALFIPFPEKDQPKEVASYSSISIDIVVFPKKPCQPDDTAFLLETWRFLGCISDFYRIEYKDGIRFKFPALVFDSPFKKLPLMDIRWRSPVTMPNIACRHIWTVGKVEALQMESIKWRNIDKIMVSTKNSIDGQGIYNDFQEWFTKTYNLPPDRWGWLIERG